MNLKKIDFDQIQSYIQRYNAVVDLAEKINQKPSDLIDLLLNVGAVVLEKTSKEFQKETQKVIDEIPESFKQNIAALVDNLNEFTNQKKQNEVKR